MSSIESRLREFISRNFLYAQTDTPLRGNDSLLEKGIIDSTGVLELVAFLEKEYGIEVEDEELTPENLDSVHNLVAFVERKLRALA